MNKFTPIIIIGLILFSSCSNEKEEVANFTRCFFASFTDSEYGKPNDYYPIYDSLHIDVSSDAVDMEEKDIYVKDKEIEVHCLNSYTDDLGSFRQDSVILYIKWNKEKQLYIENSKGFVNLDKNSTWFGLATGAIPYKTKLTDLELQKRQFIITSMILSKYLHWKLRLYDEIKILNWSWETSYSGDAHGEGQVVNNLNIPFAGIKYKITYFDRHHNFMAEDDGTIHKELAPGEKYNFTFWSSNAKNPSRAKLELEFTDKQIYEMIERDNYTGNEYKEFLKYFDNFSHRESEL